LPLISVLIPCHNAETWLREAVESVQSQTVRDLEILIYNDGSTDRSWQIIEHLARSDSRIVAMGETANRGIVHALNTLLGAASGPYIARMDGDDISLPRRFEEQLLFMDTSNVDLCGTWFKEFGGGFSRSVRWCADTDQLRAAMLFQNTICHPTMMARREIFDHFTYRESHELAEDYDLFVRALSRYRLGNVPKVLLRYRRHKQQATRARRSKMEEITRRIRVAALLDQGVACSAEEQHTHNLIRAPQSVCSIKDLDKIEAWLLKLSCHFEHPAAKGVIASQWTRAAIRAAPLGWDMWRRYHRSPLLEQFYSSARMGFDLAVLAAMRLDYNSPAFELFRRFGLSA
jgi:glycosyltransferase involved in cell wall biosynthesis